MRRLQNKTALAAVLKGDAGRVLATVLAQEGQHRTKNLFAVMLAVVSRNFVGKHGVKQAEAAAIDCLQSRGKTHLMLFDREPFECTGVMSAGSSRQLKSAAEIAGQL